MVIDTVFNFLLGWTLKLGSPLVGVLIISFIITLLTTLVYKYFTDQNALKQIKEDNKKLQEEMKKYKDDPKKVMELQKEAFSKGFMEPMKHQLKPLLITFIPFLLIFSWMRKVYAASDAVVLNLGIMSFGWFGTYIISSIVFSMILRKVMNVY